MDNEIQLISDGDGLAVIGDPTAVECFLDSVGLLSLSKDLGLHRLGSVLGIGAGVVQAGPEIAANSVRWVKLTPESAQDIKDFGLMESKTPGVSFAMVGNPGSIKSWLQIEMGPGSLLTNPAILAGAAGIMDQLARQQEMNEIRDYLAKIDKKVDEVLRNQNYAEWAKRSRQPRGKRCSNSAHSRRSWRTRPRSVISPRRPRQQSPRFGSCLPFWLVASNYRKCSTF
jgi:hypothetical protein